jgi:hypothetical protein
MCSDAPEPDENIGKAALANVDLSREAIAYYRDRDAAQAPRQAKLDDLTEQLANQQLETSKFTTDQAKKTFDRYNAVGVPAEDAMYRDAANYDSQASQDKAAGAAGTDVDVSMAQAADAQRRQLARAGVNPADGRSIEAGRETATQGALAKATAMNGARTKVQDMGIMLRKDAANFAKGMSGNAAQTYGVAAAAGSGATGAVTGAINTANATTATMGAGFGTAISGNNSAGSILNQEYGTTVGAANSSNSGMASLAGTAATVGIAI